MVILTILIMNFNKYEKILKIEKTLIVLINWWWFIFHAILLSFDSPSNYNCYKLYKILMVLDEKSNDNEIWITFIL
jgi:hypothetical protein